MKVYLKGEKDKERKKADRGGFRLKWEENKWQEYQDNMEKRWVETDGGDKNGLQKRWDIIIKNIWEAGRELKMVKEIKRENNGEWNGAIREHKRKTWKALKVWTKTRNEKDREDLKRERKRLREIRKEKQKEVRGRKRKKLENNKNMGEF